MHYLLTLMTQIAAFAAVAYVYMGNQWITVGYNGLHPMIAGAIALSLVALPYGLAYWVRWRDSDDYEMSAKEQAAITADWLRLHPLPKNRT